MIPLEPTILSNNLASTLTSLQLQVDSKPDFRSKVTEAQALWKSKGGAQGKVNFEQIRKKLSDLCVLVEVCNYCEQSEANDIEHIYPKSFFPEKTFDWENYILACKQCNTAYKLDKCFVINNHDDVVAVARGQEPGFKDGAFINPRTEDPNSFMLLSCTTFKFMDLPTLSQRNKHKALKTIDILQLNERDTLIQARKSAAKYYYQRMTLLVEIINAASPADISNSLTPYDEFLDMSRPLDDIKNDIKVSFKNELKNHQHPSVWYSIKVIESKSNPKWIAIFSQIPEALQW